MPLLQFLPFSPDPACASLPLAQAAPLVGQRGRNVARPEDWRRRVRAAHAPGSLPRPVERLKSARYRNRETRNEDFLRGEAREFRLDA